MAIVSGKVVDIFEHGDMVMLNIMDLRLDRIETVHIDGRMYTALREAEGLLMGHYVRYDGTNLTMDPDRDKEEAEKERRERADFERKYVFKYGEGFIKRPDVEQDGINLGMDEDTDGKER